VLVAVAVVLNAPRVMFLQRLVAAVVAVMLKSLLLTFRDCPRQNQLLLVRVVLALPQGTIMGLRVGIVLVLV
jgi:hypothetical protein